ncbi:MAG: phosphotransferase [Fibrella sp.]|nr:phosphotransferase [Armatimonadota bacterium]
MQAMQPCPVRVTVLHPELNAIQQVVLRVSRNIGGVEREAIALPCLRDIGLPVPQILAGPECESDGESFAVLEFLPGFTLQVLADSSEQGAFVAKQLLVDSIVRLFETTAAMSESPVVDQLPSCSLYGEWVRQKDASGHWGSVPRYSEVLRQLEPLCLQASSMTPLVFSNGDYQPANFLTDGGTITGFLDFEKAGFEDPLWTLARYPVYDLEPFQSHGLAQEVLNRLGFTAKQFAARVALFGLRTLRTKTSPDGTRNGVLQNRVWELVESSLRQAEE